MKFIAKIRDKSILDTKSDEFFIDADLILRNYKSFATITSQIPKYTINPVTNRLPFNSTDSLEKLPYFFQKSDFDKILNDSSYRLHNLTIPCIDFQLEKGSQYLIPPYFFCEDITSQTFNVNIENILNVIKYVKDMDATHDIYAAINISCIALTNENTLRYIASSYQSDEFVDHIKGYYLFIDGLDCNTADEETLIGLLQLIKSLSKKDVYIVAMNAFGYVPLLIGAKGFISGLGSSETLSIENWKLDSESQNSARPRPSKFTYMSEVFAYLDEYELSQMGYKCTCSFCNNSLPKTAADKKKHFLACRKRDIENIFTGDFNTNLNNLTELFTNGKKRVIQMLESRGTTKKKTDLLSPINKWLKILENVSDINKQAEIEDTLNNILLDIDSND